MAGALIELDAHNSSPVGRSPTLKATSDRTSEGGGAAIIAGTRCPDFRRPAQKQPPPPSSGWCRSDGVFDLVLSNSTLDHFENGREIGMSLTEINRVLAPGGRLILTLDNRANPAVALRNVLPFPLLKRLGLVPYYVRATCGPWRGARMLTEAGYRLLDVTAITHCPRVLAVVAARICERLGGAGAQRLFLNVMMAFERLERWPTRYQTGYFVALLAEKPPDAAPTTDRASTFARGWRAGVSA